LERSKWSRKERRVCGLGHAKKSGLFGLHLWRSGGKQITITEGELDCLSVAEALDGRYPVISVNNGAQSAKRLSIMGPRVLKEIWQSI